MSGVKRRPRSTSRQQLVGKGRVVWLILQCLEAEPLVGSGALAQRAAGTRLWALKTRIVSRIATVRFIISGEPFKALPPHKLKHLACQPRTNDIRQFQPLMTATAYKQYKPAGCLDQAKNQLRVLPHVGRSATIASIPRGFRRGSRPHRGCESRFGDSRRLSTGRTAQISSGPSI